MPTLLDVNATVRAGFDKISTPDLTNAYDNVNRTMLCNYCRNFMRNSIIRMIPEFIQELSV